MTMSEVEVDRITQQVFAARNSGLDAALVKVVIDEIEKATEAQAAKIARVEKLAGLFDRIADGYEAGETRYPTNSVTARSVAARIRAELSDGVW